MACDFARAPQSKEMGLLSVGTPLSWEEASKHVDHVRHEGIKQFLNSYKLLRGHNPNFWSWGDEIEYLLVELDDTEKNAHLSLRGEELVHQLAEIPKDATQSIWHPEYAKFMLESTPALPYSRLFKSLLDVESNMRLRRATVKSRLNPNERLLSMANFPTLGLPSALPKSSSYTNETARSCFVPDEVINSHARFATLTRNIRIRRGEKVEIALPLFRDESTDPTVGSKLPRLFPNETPSPAVEQPNQVYMDCMTFGMGCCCLQLTIQAADMEEARFIYDQFAILAPLMLSLSASSPIFRGLLVDTDCRWSVIESSVDDRNRVERGIDKPQGSEHRQISKSRYSSVSRFISTDISNRPEYNDLAMPINAEVEAELLANEVDPLLAKHIAFLYIRDPLVIYRELLQQDNGASMDHFENIQSTNWHTCRFKPPSLTNPELGWRVEFRPMEVQLSDRENAAFTVFSVLLIRAILHHRTSLYIPLSLVDENMVRAQKRDAYLQERFYFRTNLNEPHSEAAISLLSLDAIFNGCSELPGGLIGLVRAYLDDMNVESPLRQKLEGLVELISQRASGALKTNARFIRDYVTAHPLYAHDSVVTDAINYDLVKFLAEYV